MNRKLKFRAWDGEKMIIVNDIVFSGKNPKAYWKENSVIESSETIMQLIGLKDDNEKEIYEGDIITNIKGELLAIEWNDDTCKWQFSNGDDINDGDTYSSYKVVVGNIYETPHLLNKDQEVKECDATKDDSSKTA